MSIFNGKDGWSKKVEQFVNEKHLQNVDKEYNDALRNIVISKSLFGSAPVLDRQSQYLTQYYQEMIDQNYILMRQNQEIIDLLKERKNE
ncbi:MAG: hypothetical protein ACI31O_07705 [Limosilactobacillus vaginalis]|uniref:hypothetical protein n=1 Tax=Limosilactobacillus vaginalis TaxID=1633 RepID=UPI003F09C3EA